MTRLAAHPTASTSDASAPTATGSAIRRSAFASRALTNLWRSRLAGEPLIEPDRLIDAAKCSTGLTDLGDNALWHRSLHILCDSLNGEARLSPLGKTIAWGQLRAILRDRLIGNNLWKRHPEIADVPIASPIIVIGQMRSGTTRIQRLLSCDRSLRYTRFFESWNPVPLRRIGLMGDDRRARARLALLAVRLLNPQFAAIHPTSINAPDEEIGLNSYSLFGSAFEAQWRIPSFARYCEDRDTIPIYNEFKKLLQTLRWLRRDEGQPWVLKLPQMTQDLDTVLQLFPDARLVVLDRPQSALLASSVSLVENQMRLQSDHVDRAWIEGEWLNKLAMRGCRMERALTSFSGPIARVAYDAVEHDWQGQIAGIYKAIGLPLHAETIDSMQSYIARSALRPIHEYDMRPAADLSTWRPPARA